jgi:hypothetical protein
MNGMSYSNPVIGESDGALSGTSATLPMGGSYNDPRVNVFRGVSGDFQVELCNRNGNPGQVGAGTHWILDIPLPPTPPQEATGFSVIYNS